MENKSKNKAQSAMEFLATYAWAFLLLAIILIGLYYFVSLPAESVPAKCTFVYGITCEGVSVGSNSVGMFVNLYLVNGQEYNLVEPTVATAVIYGSGTANTMCIPSNVLQGGVMVCSIKMPTPIPQGQTVTGTLFLNSSVCITGGIANCQNEQPISYLGNFTSQVAGNPNPITIAISLSKAPSVVAPNTQSTVVLTAHVNIFGQPARGAGVLFNIVSDTSMGTTNTLSEDYALSDPTGSAQTDLEVNSSSRAGVITVTAAFAGQTATNTISIT